MDQTTKQILTLAYMGFALACSFIAICMDDNNVMGPRTLLL